MRGQTIRPAAAWLWRPPSLVQRAVRIRAHMHVTGSLISSYTQAAPGKACDPAAPCASAGTLIALGVRRPCRRAQQAGPVLSRYFDLPDLPCATSCGMLSAQPSHNGTGDSSGYVSQLLGACAELGGKPPHLPGRTHVHVHSKDPSTACGDANDALTAPASPPIPSARVTSLSRAQSDSTTVASERILEAPAATTSRTADASEQGLLASGRAPACGGGSSSSSPASSDAVAAAGSSTWALDVTSRGTQQASTRAVRSGARLCS